uniref:Bores hole in peptidoglycan layer allowing type IV secretion complex assembly to occur (VirB1) n=1 Tax=Sphingomonas sp. JE1 TaxID=1628059 RepID=A0A0D5A0A6_9SPHN|nr:MULTISPECIES: lytic transglycosylase domain-containing protein [unclassified Sphingomonas]AJW29613.1 Bores hole in peptidoglycan layer allowing type IV secretion complex assembly to occur (VirB1) [Sphingomonas sp. JE1]
MQFTTAAIIGLAAQCANGVAPSTIAAVVHTESKGYQFALNVNGVSRQPDRPTSAADAARIARSYIARGHSVDLGLGQINSRNMDALGLSWDSVFDPCTNIGAAGQVLEGNYRRVRNGRMPQEALRVALSMYNTGSQIRGFRNGYVGRVLSNAGVTHGVTPVAYAVTMPATEGRSRPSATMLADLAAENRTDATPTPASSLPPSWDVFSRAAFERARHAETGGS